MTRFVEASQPFGTYMMRHNKLAPERFGLSSGRVHQKGMGKRLAIFRGAKAAVSVLQKIQLSPYVRIRNTNTEYSTGLPATQSRMGRIRQPRTLEIHRMRGHHQRPSVKRVRVAIHISYHLCPFPFCGHNILEYEADLDGRGE
jgi:hypothetical protein